MGAIYFAEDPFPQTSGCARLLQGEGLDVRRRLLTIYCVKSSQPELSRSRLAGLRAMGHTDDTATAYFRVDWTRDLQHAAAARQALAERLPGCDQEMLLGHAEAVQRSIGSMLDAVDSLPGS